MPGYACQNALLEKIRQVAANALCIVTGRIWKNVSRLWCDIRVREWYYIILWPLSGIWYRKSCVKVKFMRWGLNLILWILCGSLSGRDRVSCGRIYRRLKDSGSPWGWQSLWLSGRYCVADVGEFPPCIPVSIPLRCVLYGIMVWLATITANLP